MWIFDGLPFPENSINFAHSRGDDLCPVSSAPNSSICPTPPSRKKAETPASDYDAKEEGDQVCKAFFVKKYPPVTADGSIDGFNPLFPLSPSPPSFPNLINLVLHLLSPIFLLTYQRAALNKISGAQHLVSRPRPETE